MKPPAGLLVASFRFVFCRIGEVKHGRKEFIIEIHGHQGAGGGYKRQGPEIDKPAEPDYDRLVGEYGDGGAGGDIIEKYGQ